MNELYLDKTLKEINLNCDTPAFTTKEVAEYLNVTQRTIFNLIRRSELPGFQIGIRWRFRKEDIDKWVKERIRLKSRKYTES